MQNQNFYQNSMGTTLTPAQLATDDIFTFKGF